MKPITELNSVLENAKKIVITTHQNPDADALGSSLGMYFYLQKKGFKVTIISSTSFPDFLDWMPDSKKIVLFENHKEKSIRLIREADILFCLDFNIISRTSGMMQELKKYRGIKALIDHHLLPDTTYFNYGVSMPEKSSTCEMIYDYIIAQGDAALIDADIANCLYAGTMTDTGSFRFPCTQPSTHRMVGHLMELGANVPMVHEYIFDTYKPARLKFLGYLLSNKMELIPEYQASLITVSEQEMLEYEVKSSDTEGIVNYPLSIKGIRFSTFINQKENEVKLSFRSKGDLDVSIFARKYFNGGGHANAAGGKVEMSLEATQAYFKEKLIEHFSNTTT